MRLYTGGKFLVEKFLVDKLWWKCFVGNVGWKVLINSICERDTSSANNWPGHIQPAPLSTERSEVKTY